MGRKKMISSNRITKMLGVPSRKVSAYAHLCPGAIQRHTVSRRWSFLDTDATWIFFDRVTFGKGRGWGRGSGEYTEEDYAGDLLRLKQKGLLIVEDIVAEFGMSALEVILSASRSPGSCRIGKVRGFDNDDYIRAYFRNQKRGGV